MDIFDSLNPITTPAHAGTRDSPSTSVVFNPSAANIYRPSTVATPVRQTSYTLQAPPVRSFMAESPGDGHAVHLTCVVQADHEMLTRSHNAAYALMRQQVDSLSREIDRLQGELTESKRSFDTLVMNVPQLIGMNTHSLDVSSNPSVITPPAPSCTCLRNVVLGFGLDYPPVPDRPAGVTFQFWEKAQYESRITKKNKSSKGGRHSAQENVGQSWLEDDNGKVISGVVAKAIREMLTSLFHSLIWSGQASPISSKLPHEARVYIHFVLARHFPFLLLCEDGRWKINELITAAYSSFAGTHIKGSVKKDFDRELSSQASKRPRASSSPADSISDPAPKVPRLDSHAPSTAIPSSTIPTLSHVGSSQADTDEDNGSAVGATSMIIPSSLTPDPFPVTIRSASHPTPTIAQTFTVGTSSADAYMSNTAAASGHVVSQPEPASVPVMFPALHIASEPGHEAAPMTFPALHIPENTIQAPPTITRTDSGPTSTVQVTVSEPRPEAPPVPELDRSSGELGGSAPAEPKQDGATASDPTAGSLVKASSRYKPDTISPKNLFIGQKVREDPDVLYDVCVAAFKELSKPELDSLREECRLARKQKKSRGGSAYA